MILVLFTHLLYQTDAVDFVEPRSIAGWSLVFFVALQILVNCLFLLYTDLKNLYRRIKLYKIKRENLKKWKLHQLIEQKIR